MTKIPIFYFCMLFVAVFVPSCAVFADKTDDLSTLEMAEAARVPAGIAIPPWLLDTRPDGSRLFLVGYSSLLSKRNDEKIAALQDAARQAGVFTAFWGSSQDFVASSLKGTNLEVRTKAYYDIQAEADAFENAKPEKVWQTDSGTWILFSLEKGNLPPLNWHPQFDDGKPSWVLKIPEIQGWHTAVGIGIRQSTLPKTFWKADEAALAQIIQHIHGKNSTISAIKVQSGQTWSQSNAASVFYGQGFGLVRGFLIVSRWYDGSSAWSLAVCPKEWNGSRL